MRLLLADETNSNPDTSDFFIYGGLHFDIETMPELDDAIREKRRCKGYRRGDDLKWNGQPEDVSPEEHASIKDSLLDLAQEHNAQFIPVMVLYELIEDTKKPIQWVRCMRDLLGQFKFSLDDGESGIAVMDHLPEGGEEEEKEMLENAFSYGLTFGGDNYVRLDDIKLISTTYSKASHVSSLLDIVLGAFQFCINNPGHSKSPYIFNKVARITKGYKGDTFNYEYGIVLRPKDPGDYGGEGQQFGLKYHSLKNTIDGLLQNPS